MQKTTKEIEGKRAAAYIRVSHDEQAQHGLSLEAQRQNLKDYAKNNKLKLIDIYADEGITARKNPKNRKEFKRMLLDVQSGSIDLIIFIKLDRWFRNVKDYYLTQEILDQHKVQWIATLEDYDTTTATGRLNLNIRLSIAQDESDRTGERIRFVFENKLRNKEVISGGCPFGIFIKDKHYAIDNEKAPIVRDLFNYYIKIKSRTKTMDYLYQKYGVPLKYITITRMIRNRLYIGEYKDIADFCPATIDKSTFERANEIDQQRSIRINPSGNTYIFSGLIVCDCCGRKMVGTGQHIKYIDGEPAYRYRCNKRYIDHDCENTRHIPERKLEACLIKYIRPMIEKNIAIHEVSGAKEKVASIATERTTIKNKLKRLQELYLNELIEIENYKTEFKTLQSRLAVLESKKTITTENLKIVKAKEFLEMDFESKYLKMSREEKTIFWNSIIDKIVFCRDSPKLPRDTPILPESIDVTFL